VILNPLTVGRSFRRTDSLCARRRCPMRSSRHRSSCEYARTAQQEQPANGRADLLPLLKPPASSTTLRSVALGKGKGKTKTRPLSAEGVSARRPASAARRDWHRFARPVQRCTSAGARRCSVSILPQACSWCSQHPILQSNCLFQTACIRLHMHDFTLIKL